MEKVIRRPNKNPFPALITTTRYEAALKSETVPLGGGNSGVVSVNTELQISAIELEWGGRNQQALYSI